MRPFSLLVIESKLTDPKMRISDQSYRASIDQEAFLTIINSKTIIIVKKGVLISCLREAMSPKHKGHLRTRLSHFVRG